jgi:hypothetical protein
MNSFVLNIPGVVVEHRQRTMDGDAWAAHSAATGLDYNGSAKLSFV